LAIGIKFIELVKPFITESMITAMVGPVLASKVVIFVVIMVVKFVVIMVVPTFVTTMEAPALEQQSILLLLSQEFAFKNLIHLVFSHL